MRRSLGSPDVVVPVLVVAGVYATTLLSTYAFTDDYHVLYTATRNNRDLIELDSAGGRPLTGLLHELTFSLATDVSSLRWVRAFGLVGLLATTVALALLGRRLGLRRLGAGALAIAACVVPGAQMLVTWAVMAPAAWASAFGVLAAVLHADAMRSERHRRRWWYAAAFASSLLAVSIYQPSALVVIPAIVAVGVCTTESARRFAAHLLSGGAIVALSMAVYAVVFAVSRVFVDSFVEERSRLTDDPIGKLRWFVDDVLVRASQPWDLTPAASVAAVVVAIVLVGVALAGRAASPGLRVLRVLAAALSLPSAYVSGLLVEEQWPSARSRVGLEMGIVVLLAAGATALARLDGRHRAMPIAAGAAGALGAALLAGVGAWHVTAFITEPQAVEYAVLRAVVRDADIGPDDVVVVRASRPERSLAPFAVLDEHGLPSSFQPWVPAALVELEVLHTKGYLVPTVLVQLPDAPPVDAPPGAIVLDFDARLAAL